HPDPARLTLLPTKRCRRDCFAALAMTTRDKGLSLRGAQRRSNLAATGAGACAPREDAMAKGLLIAAMDYSDVAEDEFHDWYDTEHIPERLAVPGFRNAERWLGSANPRPSVALYD